MKEENEKVQMTASDADGRDEIVQREIHKRDNENADNRHQVAFNTQQRKDQRVFDDLDQR